MKTEVILLSGVLLVLGLFLAGSAYQIRFMGRVDRIKLGSAPLAGAAILQRQFAALHALQASSCVFSALIILFTGRLTPGVWIFTAGSCLLAVRRHLLVRALEIKAGLDISR